MAENYQHSSNVTGWVGWIYFASFLMMLSGAFQIIAGLVALFKQDVFVVAQNHLLVFDYSQWGWVHIIIGIVLFLSAFSLFGGRLWGRIVAITLASLSAIANFAFLDAYPWWSLAVIALDVLIIYAIAVHGRELKE